MCGSCQLYTAGKHSEVNQHTLQSHVIIDNVMISIDSHKLFYHIDNFLINILDYFFRKNQENREAISIRILEISKNVKSESYLILKN